MVIIQATRHILRDRDIFTLYSCYNVSLQQITKKTCKERNQLLVHTLKNCNKSFVDKKSIICHQTKTHTPTKQRHCTGYADNLVRFHGVTQGRKLISLPLERIL